MASICHYHRKIVKYVYYLRAATIAKVAKDSLKDAVTVQGWLLNSTLRYSAFLESTLRAYVMQRGLFTIIDFSLVSQLTTQ